MKTKPIAQIQHEGISTLIKELEPVDTDRFIRIFYPGSGDYTIERRNMGNRSMDELITDMKKIEADTQ